MNFPPSNWAIFALGLIGLIFCLTFLRKPAPLAKKPPPSPEAMHFHELITAGDLAAVKAAIADGIDVNVPGRIGCTPLITAIQEEQLACFELLLANGADPELTNDFNNTALHSAVQQDLLPAVETLLELGCDLGRNPKYPLKPISYDDMPLPDVPLPEELKEFMSEKEWREAQVESQKMMNEFGQNPEPQPVIADAVSVPILRLLVDRGEPLSEADPELRRQFIRLPGQAPIDATNKDFRRSRRPAFGKANPDRFDDPFCIAMIRSGQNAYAAREKFDFDDLSEPVWCYDRFGHSLTELPDGRWIGIAGEHEDSYDPDFCIYNDVVVHDGKGGINLYRYPKAVFPPTDFHSATLVDDAIIIIGNLGYPDDRRPGQTPVYRLNLADFAISRLSPSGKAPGWISRHKAVYDAATQTIRISGGELDVDDDLIPFKGDATLSLINMRWE